MAAAWCSVSYLTQGSNETVLGVTVTATVNSAKTGPTTDIYWHDAQDGSIATTWTFSPAITRVQFETIAHADAGVEEYTFTAKDSGNNNVGVPFEITNVDGVFPYTFTSPVSTIVVTYSPTTGPFGTYLKMFLETQGDSCVSAEPEVPAGYFPEDYLERRLAAEASLLPDTR